jgi:hypothetical protein
MRLGYPSCSLLCLTGRGSGVWRASLCLAGLLGRPPASSIMASSVAFCSARLLLGRGEASAAWASRIHFGTFGSPSCCKSAMAFCTCFRPVFHSELADLNRLLPISVATCATSFSWPWPSCLRWPDRLREALSRAQAGTAAPAPESRGLDLEELPRLGCSSRSLEAWRDLP